MLPRTFRFSLRTTAICSVLAVIMVYCSFWQWDRYKKKVELVKTYEQHSEATPFDFPLNANSSKDYETVLDQRIHIEGSYDYERQLIVTNKKHPSGPGHWLLTPLKIKNTDKYVLVSRGFIPFEDREKDTWSKYQFDEQDSFDAVVKLSVEPKTFGPANPDVSEKEPFPTVWFYPQIDKMAKQFPYPVITEVYLQRIGNPERGEFPAQATRIDVPPSTHFGYTIEWAVLAFVTLVIGFLIQAFPRRKSSDTK